MRRNLTDTAVLRFVVWSWTVSVEAMAAAIGVLPTEKVDQVVTDSAGRARPHSYLSYRSLTSPSDTAPLEAQFDDLVSRLAPATAGLRSLLDGGAAEAELVATCSGPGPRVVFAFAPRHVAFLASLGLGFRLVVINAPEEKRRRAEFVQEIERWRRENNSPS